MIRDLLDMIRVPHEAVMAWQVGHPGTVPSPDGLPLEGLVTSLEHTSNAYSRSVRVAIQQLAGDGPHWCEHEATLYAKDDAWWTEGATTHVRAVGTRVPLA